MDNFFWTYIYSGVHSCYDMQVSPIYDSTLEALKQPARRIIHQGGQWSGKTVGILQTLATLCNEETEGITTVTSMSMPHLKGGALRDFEMFVYPEFKKAIKQYHKTDHIFTFRSGSQLEFKSFENEQTGRGGKRKRLFINEANSFPYMLFFQLDSRSDQTIIDYNPSIQFWAHEKLIGNPGNIRFISDHRHNPFLTDSKHAEIEAYLYQDIELGKVYSRGLTGNVTGVIFPYWQMIDDNQFPTLQVADEYIFGVDFGYTNDPTAIMKMCKVADTIYVKELAYEPGMSPHEIKTILETNGWTRNMKVYCDHDPEMVKDMRNIGIAYAELARKGPGSVNNGIVLLNKHYKVKYTHSSRNLHRERGLYVFDKDKNTGNILNTPIDAHNHCFDAIRYGVYTKYLRKELKRA